MGCAVPSVASAIGANRDILAAGGGLLASTPAEFHDALSALLVDQSLRERLGKAGRARARSAYSLRANQAKFREVLCRAAATT
jgi:spore coat protein SA